MPIGNLYPEICLFLLTILAPKTSSEGKTTSTPALAEVSLECTLDKSPPDNNSPVCKSNSNDQNYNVNCSKFLKCSHGLSCYKCDLKIKLETICCVDVDKTRLKTSTFTCKKRCYLQNHESTRTASSSSKVSSGATLSPTFSSSIISIAGILTSTSSSSALSSAAEKISPTSSSSVASTVATLITTSSSFALSLAAEKFSPTSSSSLLSSVQKLSSASSSQIASSETALAPTTSPSMVSPASTLSLKPSSSIASPAAVLSLSSTQLSLKDEDILEIITCVGLSLSIIGMILTVIMYSLFTDIHRPLTQIRLSLAASLGAGQISFLAGMHAMGNTVVCRTAAVLTQYFLMAAFCWMLVEGIYFYLFIIKVYNIRNKMIVYHVMAWGFPIIMVGISLGVAIGKGGIESYTSDKYCCLSSTYDLIWIFVAFLTTTAVLSRFILARVTRELTTLPQTGATQIQRVRVGIRTCVVMIPLLGITWLFGILSPLHKTYTYIFTILNATQGVLIFTLHCVRNSQIMERLNGKMVPKQISQIRARLRERMNLVSPSADNKNSAK